MAFTVYRSVKKDPHFVDWIITQMEITLGTTTDPKTGKVTVDDSLGANLFLSGGFNIRTTIDSKLQTYVERADRKSTRLNSSHQIISYAVFCLKKKKKKSTRS